MTGDKPWHYKLTLNVYGQPSKNLCPYFWQVLFSIGYVVGMLSLFGVFVYTLLTPTEGAFFALVALVTLSTLLLLDPKDGTWTYSVQQRFLQKLDAFQHRFCTTYGEDWEVPDAWHGWVFENFNRPHPPATRCEYVLRVAGSILTLLVIPTTLIALPIIGALHGEWFFGFIFWILLGAIFLLGAIVVGVQSLRGKISDDSFIGLAFRRLKAAKDKVCPQLEFVEQEDEP